MNKKDNRQDAILELLQKSPYMTVEQLAQALYVSQSSVRRDLQLLQSKGVVRRNYGGVALASPDTFNVPYAVRMKVNAAEKKRLAIKAATLVKDGDTIFLPASSALFYLAHELVGKRGLTVITNGIHKLRFLANYQIRLICPGGMLDPEDHSALIGSETVRAIRDMRADIAFFSPQSLEEDGTLYDYYLEQIAVSKCMLQGARRRVCICDSSKIGKFSNFRVCSLQDMDVMVSETPLRAHFEELFPNLQLL